MVFINKEEAAICVQTIAISALIHRFVKFVNPGSPYKEIFASLVQERAVRVVQLGCFRKLIVKARKLETATLAQKITIVKSAVEMLLSALSARRVLISWDSRVSWKQG